MNIVEQLQEIVFGAQGRDDVTLERIELDDERWRALTRELATTAPSGWDTGQLQDAGRRKFMGVPIERSIVDAVHVREADGKRHAYPIRFPLAWPPAPAG
jgi:hypothetical protein